MLTPDIIRRFQEGVVFYKPLLGLKDWVIDVRSGNAELIGGILGDFDDQTLACTLTENGLRRAVMYLNEDGPWADQMLVFETDPAEIALHELLHVVLDDTAFMTHGVANEARTEFAVDRLADIIGGLAAPEETYFDDTESCASDTCCGNCGHRDDGP